MSKNEDKHPSLIGVGHVARMLGLGRTKVRAMMLNGEIPSALIGQKRMARRSDVEAYIDNAFSQGPTIKCQPENLHQKGV